MTPIELMQACDSARRNALEYVMLKMPRRRPPRGDRVRLFGRAGPLVDVVHFENGTLTVWAVADEVMAWLRRNAPEMPTAAEAESALETTDG